MWPVTAVASQRLNLLPLTVHISVVDDTLHRVLPDAAVNRRNDFAEPIWCESGSPTTKAAVILDSSLNALSLSDVIRIITGFASHLKVAQSSFKLSSLSHRMVHDSQALASGPGNTVLRNDEGLLVEWTVGCGNVLAAQIPVLQNVEKSAADGSLAKAIGYDCVGWRVVNLKARHAIMKRIRRKTARRTYLDLNDPIYYSGDGNKDEAIDAMKPTTRLAVAPTLASPKVSSSSHITPTPDRNLKTTTTPGLFNNPPLVKNFLKLLVVRVGESLNFTIPIDTFIDLEDGDTRRLRLELVLEDGMPLPSAFWLKFLPDKQTILALPGSKEEGRHSFLLRAIDSHGETGQERVRFRVQPRKRNYGENQAPYESSVTLDFDYWAFSSDIERPIDLLQRIAVKLFKNENSSMLMMTRLQAGSVIFSWSNTSLTALTCDATAMRKIHSNIIGPNGYFTRDFVAALSPYKILRYTSGVNGVCVTDAPLVAELVVDVSARLPATTIAPVTPRNTRPDVTKPLTSIQLKLGRLFNFSIPEETFHDREDGNTRSLKLIFLANDSMTVTRKSWVQLNEDEQSFYGLPMQLGHFEFTLVAYDSGSQMAKNKFTFNVVDPRTPINHEFQLLIDIDYTEYAADMLFNNLDFAHRIAHLYGDADANKLTILRVGHDNGKGPIDFIWTNHTVRYEPCPAKQLGELMSFLILPNDTIAEALNHVFEPLYIKRIAAEPLGPCRGKGVVPVTLKPSTAKTMSSVPQAEEEISREATRALSNDMVMTAAVPAAIIIVVVVIVLFVVCFLYTRSKRKGKLNLQEHHKPPVKAGAPVIFADELAEERPESPTKPLILDREHPPLLPPPEYPRIGGTNGTLRSEHGRLLESDNRGAMIDTSYSSHSKIR